MRRRQRCQQDRQGTGVAHVAHVEGAVHLVGVVLDVDGAWSGEGGLEHLARSRVGGEPVEHDRHPVAVANVGQAGLDAAVRAASMTGSKAIVSLPWVR